jgi:hypothetical protein
MSIEQRLNRLEGAGGEFPHGIKCAFSLTPENDERLRREHQASGDIRQLIIITWIRPPLAERTQEWAAFADSMNGQG